MRIEHNRVERESARQMKRTYPSWVPAMSVAQTIERFLIDHVREHLENILPAIGPPP